MGLKLGDTAPDFTIDSTAGQISFHDWAGDSWVFFFSHPADFTPVCTTEMGRTAQLSKEFAERNTKPLGLSTDTVEEHVKWIAPEALYCALKILLTAALCGPFRSCTPA